MIIQRTKGTKRFVGTVLRQSTIYRGVITVEDIREKFKIPEDADITVQVPGGGDWANTQLHMGDDFPHLEVTWEVIR